MYETSKRALDLVCAVALLAASAPLMGLIALLVRLDSPGPAIFRQVRLGQGGRPFTMYKFRTMVSDADPQVHQAYIRQWGQGTPAVRGPGGPVFKLANDPRVTRVGRVLRALSLDELPQLWNVLRGEMSMVGPRPAMPYELELFRPWYFRRLDVLPGITGLWQVTARSRVSFEGMVRLDLLYVDRRSLLLDLKLLLLTIPTVLLRKGGL